MTGEIAGDLTLNGEKIVTNFKVVQNMIEDVIVGLEFLESIKAKIYIYENTIEINGNLIEFSGCGSIAKAKDDSKILPKECLEIKCVALEERR